MISWPNRPAPCVANVMLVDLGLIVGDNVKRLINQGDKSGSNEILM